MSLEFLAHEAKDSQLTRLHGCAQWPTSSALGKVEAVKNENVWSLEENFVESSKIY